MPKPMTGAQRGYIEKLTDFHDFDDDELNAMAEEVTGFPGATWEELNVKEASDLLDHILKTYGGFDSEPRHGRREKEPDTRLPSERFYGSRNGDRPPWE